MGGLAAPEGGAMGAAGRSRSAAAGFDFGDAGAAASTDWLLHRPLTLALSPDGGEGDGCLQSETKRAVAAIAARASAGGSAALRCGLSSDSAERGWAIASFGSAFASGTDCF